MAFVLRQIKSLPSFDACASFYDAAQQLPNHPHGERARNLGAEGKKYLSIRPSGDAFIIRYHKTDVVIWERDRVTIDTGGYETQSTAKVASSCTPWNLGFTFHLETDDNYVRVALNPLREGNDVKFAGHPWAHQARCYAFDRTISFVHSPELSRQGSREIWVPAPDHTYKATFIDAHSQALNTALRKTRYFDFVPWLNAVMALDQRPKGYDKEVAMSDEVIAMEGVLNVLQDVTKWEHLVNYSCWVVYDDPHSVIARRENIKKNLREAIYTHYKAVPTRQVEWYDWDQFAAQRRLRSLPWAI